MRRMPEIGLLCVGLLAPVVGAVADDAKEAAALAEYNAKRDRTPRTADAQWRLALWCEQRGLAAEAKVHLSAVVRLDPGRAAAWRKLGFRKYNGRWMNDEQVAEAKRQEEADRRWGPILRQWHKEIHGGKRQVEAEAAFTAITDPTAVPSIFREFAGGSPSDQVIAVQLFGQVLSPLATKALAALAVYGGSAEVRRRAGETLRGRDPAEYVKVLAALLVKVLRYEVRPVGGPGSPGVLYVEGERFNVKRYYAPPPPPMIALQAGDIVTFDQDGLPVITRPGGVLATLPVAGTSTALQLRQAARFSLGQNAIEAQRGALSAQAQLQADQARIEAANAARRAFNERVLSILKDATGKDPGDRPEDWTTWLAARAGQSPPRPETRPRRTVEQRVPLDYNPVFGQLMLLSQRVVDT